VDQTVGTADVDECAKICQAGDTSLADFTFRQLFHDLVADLFAGFRAGGAFAEDKTVALTIDFDHANCDWISDETLVFGFGGLTRYSQPSAEAELGCGNETADCRQRNQQPTLVISNNGGFKALTGSHGGFSIDPALFLNRANKGKNQIAFLVVGVNHKDRDGFSNLESRKHFLGDCLIFFTDDQTLGFGSNTDQDL